MGNNAGTNRKGQPPPNHGNFRYPAYDQYGPSPRPLDRPAPGARDGPSPRPPRPGEQGTDSSFEGAVNPWLDTSPIMARRAPPYQPPVNQQPPPAITENPSYDAPVPPREPPPYRQAQPPPPIYQPVRPRPYLNQYPGYAAPPPPPPPPQHRYPRAPAYNQHPPRYHHRPYVVEPLRYRKPHPGYEPQYQYGPDNKPPPPIVVDAPVVPAQDPDKEVATLLEKDLKPKEDIPDEVQSKKEKDDDDYIGANLRFYRNEIKFRPNGEYIDNMHKYWHGDYKRLEDDHTYIQWLFPISEKSRVNPEAVPLRQHEAKHIKDDKETKERVIKSYRMMLDYLGLDLTDEETGKVARSDDWKDRFYNFKKSYHNHFRVTRIIRSLGELGFSHYQAPFLMRLLHEIYETGELQNVPPITIHHWFRTIETDFDRDYVYNLFKDKIFKHEKDYKNGRNHDVNMYYYESLPKKRRPIPIRQPYQ